jgi:hypothetical protein
VFSPIRKAFTCLTIVLLLSGVVGAAFGWDYYPASYNWGFQNYSYLSFNQPMNFTDTPRQGLPIDGSLVGYWNMNEGLGVVANDSSGNGNNGVIYGASWVDGKFGKALSFDGMNDYASIPITPSTTFGANDFSISCWFKVTNATLYSALISTYIGGTNIFVRWLGSPLTLQFVCAGTGNQVTVNSGMNLIDNQWHQVTVTRSGSIFSIYIDGVLKKSVTNTLVGYCCSSTNQWLFMKTSTYVYYTSGILDEVRFYNRALSAVEATALYAQPDPVSFANYYNYQDPVTNNTMLIYVDNPNGNSSNVALVTCTNFFTSDRLTFQANNSATVNVWTNIGQPVFTTGVWNSQNYTTTLTLDASSTAEINWNTYNITTYVDIHSGVLPSNVTVGYLGSQMFNFNAPMGYRFNVYVDGVSLGQISSYTLSNVTEPHSVNVTSALLKYTVSASADLGSTISPSGDVSVNYGGSQLFTIQNKTGYNVKHVYVDDVDKGTISNYTFSNVTANHVISVSSESLSSSNSSTSSPSPQPSSTTASTSTPKPSQSPGQTNSPTPTSTTQPENNQFPTQTVAIVAATVAVLVAVLVLVFKKGYITIEVVDEETDEEQNKDGKEGNKEKNPDYSI